MIVISEKLKLALMGGFLTVVLIFLVSSLYADYKNNIVIENAPENAKLKTSVEKIVYTNNFKQTEYKLDSNGNKIKDENNKPIKLQEKNIIVYAYKTDEIVPPYENEVIEKRTPSTVTIALGDNKFVAKSGYMQAKEGEVWKKIKTATTTPEVLEAEIEKSSKVGWIHKLIQPIFADSTGLTVGGTATDEGGGSEAWQNVNNILVDDLTYASNGADLLDDDFSNYIHAENFGFAIDSGATIDGVEMRTRVAEASSDDARDDTLQLVVGGSRTGDNKSTGATWTSSPTYRTVGGSSDTWSISLTPAIVNATDFGAAFRFQCVERSDCATGNERLYSIELNIYYTAGADPVDTKIKIGNGKIKVGGSKIKL